MTQKRQQDSLIKEGSNFPVVLDKSYSGEFFSGDTTPSVKDAENWKCHTTIVTITNFDDGASGQTIFILGSVNTTIANNANIKTNTGANKVLANNIVYAFKNYDSIWIELGEAGGGGLPPPPSSIIGIGADGLDGVDGMDGLDGRDGTDGADGDNGLNGKDGKDGKDGSDGSDGFDGLNGKDGLNGSNGLNGNNGIDGIDGVDGLQGLKGDKGDAGGGGLTLTTVEISLGTPPLGRLAGKFQITGLSGLTVAKPVLIHQANGPYTGKGTLADEAEMDQLTVTGKVISASAIQCYWNSFKKVRGNFKFDYAVSA